MTATPGTVHLVGAGPGDPGLLTLRGAELLQTCDAVVVDALVDPQLLRHCRDDVERHDVGKRAGQHSASQDDINALLISLARQGKSVVRLKGGDPFVFGRGGEECEALRDAGVAYEVVPGVTSAVAAPATAGIPVTHRDWAGHVTIVTGHEREGEEGRIDFAPLAALLPQGTLVVLMGARTLPDVAQQLIDHGADPQTPAAAVQWGTDPRQRAIAATLATIAGAVTAAGLGSPMVTVVGRVAALRDRLEWFERRPLHGRRIVVTRARAQASGFLERLRSMGADAVEVPVIAVEQAAEQRDLDAALDRVADPHHPRRPAWAVFTSANAVDLIWNAMQRRDMDARALAGIRLCAIGPETAAALRVHGLHADLVPDEYVAEAVADAMVAQGVSTTRVWLPRAAAARDVLPDRLREAGAEVDVLPLYRTVLPADAGATLQAELDRGPVDAVTFTSSSTVQHFLQALAGRPFPQHAIAACIGPITARAAEAAGLPVHVVATEYTTVGLAAALAAHFGVMHTAAGR